MTVLLLLAGGILALGALGTLERIAKAVERLAHVLDELRLDELRREAERAGANVEALDAWRRP